MPHSIGADVGTRQVYKSSLFVVWTKMVARLDNQTLLCKSLLFAKLLH